MRTPPLDSLPARLLLESSNDWMWAVDLEGRHLYTNRAIETILGYTRDEIMEMDDFGSLVHPDDRERVARLLDRAVAQRAGWQGEVVRWRRKDGVYRWLESQGNPLFDSSGELAGFCGADRDITQRMEHEQQIAESERRFRMTFERAGVGIAHVGLDGKWLRVNEPLCEMLGYTREELLQLTFQDVTHPEDLDADLAEARRLFAGEIRSYSMEKRYVTKDGSTVWGMLTASLVRDASGVPDYGIKVIRDISDRKAIEAARAQSERDYRTLFDASHDAIVLIDPADGTIVNVNQRAVELYRYSREQLIGSSIGLLSRAMELGKRNADRVIAGARQSHFESTHCRADGSMIDVHATAVLVRYGGRDAVLTAYRDVTEEKRLTRAIAANEQRFRALVEHGYDMIAILDDQRRIRFGSGSVMQTLGYTGEELTGRLLGESVHPEDLPRLVEVFAATVRSRDARPSLVCRLRTKNDEWRWCEGSAVNMLHVEGVEGIVVIARDVTERIELQSRLDQAHRVESLGRVAATVAHEFNNVLMAIQPLADVLVRKPDDPARVARVASQITAGVKRGGVIAGDILRFANPREPVRQHIELGPWLANAIEELRPLLQAGIEISVTAEESLAVDGDPEQLHQLIGNLVLNARDAMPAGGTIRITAERAGGSVVIAVRDSGIGIPPDVRAHIFEPLFTTKRKGTGLGLALCQQIATAHGGTISVESPEEGGTVFRVKMPVARASSPP